MNTTIIILGATGDLTKKKLIPSIYKLIQDKKISNFTIIGAARRVVSAQDILNNSKEYIKDIDTKTFSKLKSRFYYFPTDFNDKNQFEALGDYIRTIEKKHKLPGNRLFYLATLPSHFKVIAKSISRCNLISKKGKWSRVVFEKPFGDDLKSAKEINKCLSEVFKEEQIYRIDHYLGKEFVQNISILRFTNTIFEPLWNNKYIDHVKIILNEKIGVEGRGKFYDHYGALKDVVQNHMMQLLSLTSMDAPKKLTAKYIRDEKVKVLKLIKDIPQKDVILGQYKGYLKEVGVKDNSKTETFAALKLFINNKRWKGVPFYLIAGKKMFKKETAVQITFKKAECKLFHKICKFDKNSLNISIQPDRGVDIKLNSKIPGSSDIAKVKMNFCDTCTYGPNTPKAYENLLMDIMRGDQSVFIRSDEIEQEWRIIDKITKRKNKIYTYEKGNYPNQMKKLLGEKNE